MPNILLRGECFSTNMYLFRCPSPPKSLLWEDAFSKTEAGILYLNWPSSIGPQLKLNNIWFWPSEVSINQFLVIFFFYLKCLKSHFQVLEKKALLEEREHFFGGRNFPFHASNKNVDSFFNVEEIIRHHCQLLWKQVCWSQKSWGWKRKVILSNPFAQARLPRAGCSAQCPDELYLQGGRLPNLPGQPVPKCSPFHCFLMFRRKFLCFSSCSLLLILNPTTRVVITEGNKITTFSSKFQLFCPLLKIARNPQMRMQEHNILSTWFTERLYWGRRKWNYSKIILLSAYLENKEENPSILFFFFPNMHLQPSQLQHQNIKRHFYPQ